MIGLEKLDEPASLVRNKAKWTQELLDAIAGGDRDQIKAKKRKYNQPDVKAQLRTETNDKCAYCETKITVASHGDIEHVTPKAIEPERTFEWDNLTFACEKCNGKKSDKTGISDPYLDIIQEDFFFVGSFLRGRSEKGRLTIAELELNRGELIEDRQEHMIALADAIEKIANTNDQRLRELTLGALRDDLASRKPEYIMMKHTALKAHFPE